MKKLFILLAGLLFVTSAFANPELIRIYKNSNYRMIVNYQICFREYLSPHSTCYPTVRNIAFTKSRTYRDIKVDNAAMYVRVISAYTFDTEGLQKGHGEFGEEDCKIFDNHPRVLDDNHSSDTILCQ
ncbi:MAG: hypothetical protein ACYCQI_09080 [Gammaproteobacteria bacterium]